MILTAKPYQCMAIGCLHRCAIDEIMCEQHQAMVPKRFAELLKQHYDPTQGKSRKVSIAFGSAAYRAVTTVAFLEGKITPALAERREYYCITKLEKREVDKREIDAEMKLLGKGLKEHLAYCERRRREAERVRREARAVNG